MLLLSSMEHRLAQAAEEKSEEDEDEADAEMRKRIQIAKMVSVGYRCGYICFAKDA